MIEKYSGKKIIKAGETLLDPDIAKDESAFAEAAKILSFWRYSHEEALENAFVLIQQKSLKYEKNALFAKRLKRMVSIIVKLRRFPKMKLKNIQDIGGCRVIVSNEKKLRKILRELKKRPEFKINGKFRTKDYIKNPKDDGYRSFHLIGRFSGANKSTKSIEVQLRTKIQHYWATSLEIVDIFTGQALKSNQGDRNWTDFFANVSKQFSIMDSIHMFERLTPEEKKIKYETIVTSNREYLESCAIVQRLSRKLKVIDKLEGYSASLQIVGGRLSKEELGQGYFLFIIDLFKSTVTSRFYPSNSSDTAENDYIESEKKCAEGAEEVVALVSTSAVSDIKEVYPNYFADSTEFLKHLIIITNLKVDNKLGFIESLFSVERIGDYKKT